jgi:hypothetical protein
VIDVLNADMRAGLFFLDVDLGRDAINGVILGANKERIVLEHIL